MARQLSEVQSKNPWNGEVDGTWARVEGTGGRWYKICTNKTDARFLPIDPNLIDDSQQVGYFGRMECEHFAAGLVKLAKSRGKWTAFTFAELSAVYNHPANDDNLSFFVDLGWLVQDGQTFRFTTGFVMEVLAKNARMQAA